MHQPQKTFLDRLRRPLSGFITIWLTGIVMLFCCGPLEGASHSIAAAPVETGHSDHATRVNENADLQVSVASSASYCEIFGSLFNHDRKVERGSLFDLKTAFLPAAYYPPAIVLATTPLLLHARASFSVGRSKVFIKNRSIRI